MASLSRLQSQSWSLFRSSVYNVSRSLNTQRTSPRRTENQKNRTFRRKPVPFNLASYIHAEMMCRHNNEALGMDNGTLSHGSDRVVPDAKEGDKTDSKKTTRYVTTCQELKTALKHKSVEIVEKSLLPDISQIGLDRSLDIADIFLAHKYRQEKFLTVLLENVEQKQFEAMDAKDITRLMFYVFFHGSASHKLFFKLEEYLNNNLGSFDINDIGIVCLGYFRGMKRIVSHDLLDKIGRRVLDDFDHLQGNMLINILKTLRHSGFARISFFEDLSEKLLNSQYIDKTSNLNVLMHIAMAFVCSSMYCKSLNRALLKRFVKLVDDPRNATTNIRSKDIAKFVWAMGTVVHDMEGERTSYLKLVDVYENLSQQQDQLHPESLADLLQGLVYLQIHPEQLIARLLHPDTANTLKGHTVYAKAFQLLLINNSVLIECPSYKGRLLSESFQRSLQRVPGMTGDLDFELKTRQGLLEVLGSLQEMFGSRKVRCHFLLPHFTLADIEMRLDLNGKPLEFTAVTAVPVLPSSGGIQATITDDLLSALSSQYTQKKDLCKYRVTVQVMGGNQMFYNSSQMKGNYDTKLRQLRTLGYKTLVISPEDARDLATMAECTRRKYLLRKFQDLGLDMDPESFNVKSDSPV